MEECRKALVKKIKNIHASNKTVNLFGNSLEQSCHGTTG